ncbi:hypothetical protein [Williamsia muralis]|uniref:Uncharacterized protein n=1 Tax=Williamsia marianensis TaxID=85044 RepID=A0ABU4EW63_WILMA|nr:hypothetical protein [Williamsia muralis]MDV7135487.1 hypothetical protein [Williamsia muralis]
MSALELAMWRFTFADAAPAAKDDGNQGNVLDLEVYWTLGPGAVIAAWGYRDDLERCVAALAPKLGGNEGFATRLAQTYREMAIGAPRRLGENEKPATTAGRLGFRRGRACRRTQPHEVTP